MTVGRLFLCLIWLPAVLLLGGPTCAAAQARTVIKVAVVTPEGSTWTDALYRMVVAVKRDTGGAVDFKVYAGGISGDELDVIRKMQVGRIHAAGFSGVGLGVILPATRILESPLLFEDHREIDWVRSRLEQEFAARFLEKGYVLLGFAEAGFVYFFSQEPMTGPRGLDAVKMWVWKGDPAAKSALEAFGVTATPLHLADVPTGLETGMIDAFYSPPLAAIAFQWHTKIRYLLDYPLANSTGALLIRKQTFERLSAPHRAVLKSAAAEFCRELIQLARRENAEALEVLQSSGIVFEEPSEQQKAELQKAAQAVYEMNIPALYSRELAERVKTLLQNLRRGGG
jgi:TRAP-type C4-dicarboxylate transport system substrate-binding protein